MPSLLLENNLKGPVKIITLRYKRFLLVWQVISTGYHPPLYLLNKRRMNLGMIDIKGEKLSERGLSECLQ